MKYKFLTLSLLLAGVCATTIKAQETNYYTPKWSDNIFISVGGGIHSVANDGFNRISPNFSISLGKYITPTWGIRGQVNGKVYVYKKLAITNTTRTMLERILMQW